MNTDNLQPILAGACAKPGRKGNPFSYSSLIEYLAEKEGTSTHNKVILNNLEDYKDHKVKLSRLYVVINNTSWKVNGSHTEAGGVKKLKVSANGVFTEILQDQDFEEIYYLKRKKLYQFNTKVEKAGKFNYSEGGGWYSKKQLYKVDGKFFINY